MNHLQSLEVVLKRVSYQDVIGRNGSKNRRLNLMQRGVYVLHQLRSDAAPSGGERGVVAREHSYCITESKGGGNKCAGRMASISTA